MNETLLEELTEALSGPVNVVGERRGFAKQRGVPDSVFWLSPADDRFPDHLVPILVELEGSFTGAAKDFEKFAARYDDSDYQYHLECPVVGIEAPSPIKKSLCYDIIGIRTNSLAEANSITERKMHAKYKTWFERFLPTFKTAATIKPLFEPTVVVWTIEFTMFSHHYETQIPFLVNECEDGYSDEFFSRLPNPTVPGVVVINDKYDQHDHTSVYHETTIEFPEQHPVRFDTS